MEPTRYIAIPGTHAPDDPAEWWMPGSPFGRFLETHGCVHARPEWPMKWTRDLDGVPWEGTRSHADWEAAGYLLRVVHRDTPIERRRIIAHSYGAYAAIEAAADGFEIPILITIGTPKRQDMKARVEAALPNIGYWLHIYDASWDLIARLGQFFDGAWSFSRKMQWGKIGATDHHALTGIGHTGVLTQPPLWPLWETQGWLALLRDTFPSVNVTSTDVSHSGPRATTSDESAIVSDREIA